MIGTLPRAVEDEVEDQHKDMPRKVSNDHLVSNQIQETIADLKLELEGVPQGPNLRQVPNPKLEINPKQPIIHKLKHHPPLLHQNISTLNLPMPILSNSNSISPPKEAPLNRKRSLCHYWQAQLMKSFPSRSITSDTKVSVLVNG